MEEPPLEKCLMYQKGNAAERKYFGKTIVACIIKSENCPFRNAEEIRYGGEIIGIMCKSGGLVEMIDKHPVYTLTMRKDPKFFIDKKIGLVPELL
jgi:DNA modification methylase